jgi:hypothetical protein
MANYIQLSECDFELTDTANSKILRALASMEP